MATWRYCRRLTFLREVVNEWHKERLDKVQALIQETGVPGRQGLSNEVNIRIFCYEPANEMVVRHLWISWNWSVPLDCHLIVSNLYKIFLSSAMIWTSQMRFGYGRKPDGKLIFWRSLTPQSAMAEFIDAATPEIGMCWCYLWCGRGKSSLLMRIHTLLEALQTIFRCSAILSYVSGSWWPPPTVRHQTIGYRGIQCHRLYKARRFEADYICDTSTANQWC